MRIEIEIPDEKFHNLSENGRDELLKVATNYVEDILDEASRLEATRKSDNNPPEITATIVNDAVDYTKKYRIKKRNSWKLFWAQLIAFIFAIMTAGLFKPDNFNEIGPLILFLGVFLVAIFANVYIFFNDYKNE